MRVRLAGSTSKKDGLRADWIEGEARARTGDEAGVELLGRALATAEIVGSPYLVAEVNLSMARAAPQRTDEVRGAVAGALDKMVEQAPPDMADAVRTGPLARELDRITDEATLSRGS